jgi:PAS domain S-box-containing protein
MNESALEARARELTAHHSPDFLGALIAINEEGLILTWNDGATKLFGFSAEDAVGRSIFETIVPAEIADEKRRWVSAAVRAGTATYEAARVRKNGTRIWVDVAVRTDRAPDGQRLLILNERDITRIKYQREAQLLQMRFRGVLEASPDATVLVDTHGRMVVVNAETERLFGYTREELLGELVETLVPTRFHATHPEHRANYFADPQRRPMGIGLELAGRRKDGTEFPVEISLSPLDIDGVTLAMAAIRDVSTRKQTEEALKIANSELEAFTYSVSHDLRAPIRHIDGFAQLLAEGLGSTTAPKNAQYLERIQESSRHMGRLVDDLLHLTRIGRQNVSLTTVSLNDILDDVLERLQPELAGRAIEWRITPLPVLKCDAGLMKVVLNNLLSNAVKYSRARNPALIEVGMIAEDGHPIVFVRDNGVGFDMKYADKLFGVFQRLHRAEEFEGTGVGLATVQRIIHKHGGRIWAEAAPDKGATFSFVVGQQFESAFAR